MLSPWLKASPTIFQRLNTSIQLPSDLHSSVYAKYEPCRQYRLEFAKLSSNSSHTMYSYFFAKKEKQFH